MARQILDHDHASTSEERLTRFTSIEKDASPRIASKKLQKSAKSRDNTERTSAFLKIERERRF